VPVHKVGSNDEGEHDASQDDSEERPTAGLVVVCHVVNLPLEGLVGPDEAEPSEFSTLGRGSGPAKAPISGAYAQPKAPPRCYQRLIGQLVADRD
jgi:hypothetical protein